MLRIATIAFLLGTLVPVSENLGAALAQEVIKLGDRRIVGGEKTDISDHPWQVALKISSQDSNLSCGGSLILDKWVLTEGYRGSRRRTTELTSA